MILRTECEPNACGGHVYMTLEVDWRVRQAAVSQPLCLNVATSAANMQRSNSFKLLCLTCKTRGWVFKLPRVVSPSATSQLFQAEIWRCIRSQTCFHGKEGHLKAALSAAYVSSSMCPCCLKVIYTGWLCSWTRSYGTSGIKEVTNELSSLGTYTMHLCPNLEE